MIDVPFDISSHFDENLHDVPNNPTEVRQALAWLSSHLKATSDKRKQIQILDLMGSLARLLRDLPVARAHLTLAVEQSSVVGDVCLKTANSIRLAHVYQWQGDYAASEALFETAIATCQKNNELRKYLDFAYQHAGKCKFDKHQYEVALVYFEQALALRRVKAEQSLIESTQRAISATYHRMQVE